MPNTLISSEIGSERRTILGHPQLIECMGIYIMSLAHGSELKCSDIYLHIVKKLSGNVSLNSARVHALGWPLLWLAEGSFLKKNFRLLCGANHL